MNTILPKAPDGTSDQVSTKPGEVHDYGYEHDERGKCVTLTIRERLVRRGAGVWTQPVHEVQEIQGDRCYRPDVASWVHRPVLDRQARQDRNARIIAAWLENEPDNPGALFLAGREAVSDLSCLDLEAAVRYFQRYLEIQPEWNDHRCTVIRHLCVLLIFKGASGQPECLDEAARLTLETIHERSDWTDSYLTLAEIAEQRCDTETAHKWARRVIAMGPPTTRMAINLRDYDLRPRAILDGVSIVPQWWRAARRARNQLAAA